MKINRVRKGDDLGQWKEELARCLGSDVPGQGDYPPGQPSVDVAAGFIGWYLNFGNNDANAFALWTDGGVIWCNVDGDPLSAGLKLSREIVLRVRERGVARALRAEAERIAKSEFGVSDYYAFVTDHTLSAKVLARSKKVMEEDGYESWSRCWRKRL